MSLLLLLLVPLLIPWGVKYYWHTTVTWKEFGLQVALVAASVSIMYGIGTYNAMSDVEILNGEVTSKKMERVSCRHSYSCMCVSVSCGKGCSTQVCQTCYDHNFDNDWNLYTNLGTYRIHTIDRQGLKEPPRWTKGRVGDPVAKRRKFTNYVKAAPESIFNDNRELSEKFASILPDYPDKVFDYFNINRVLAMGVNVPIASKLNSELALRLRKLGPSKQVNAIIVFANTNDRQYRYALESKWIGGKKNDAVIIIGTTNYPTIDWVEIMSWSKNEVFNVELRDAIMEMKQIDMSLIDVIDSTINKSFVRRLMEEFEYLKDEIEPPLWGLMTILISNVILSCGLSYWMHTKDVFGDEIKNRYRRYR